MLKTWFSRVVALVALAVVVVAVIVVIGSVHSHHSTSQADVAVAVGRLNTANRNLSTQLVALQKGSSPHPAQNAVRAAQAVTQELTDQFNSSDDDLGVRMQTLLEAEHAYVNAVGSAVANPHSVLLTTVVPKANDLRAALTDVPPATAAEVRGEASLVTYSKSR